MTKHRLLVLTLVLAGCGTESAPTIRKTKGPTTAAGPVEVALLAGGCFWGMEHVMRDAPGIVKMEVGYAGGASTHVGYEDVSEGATGHAETVRIEFDSSKISYQDLLTHWYFRGHDPTQKNRQNNDVGTQYRSAIFTTSPAQAKAAAAVISKVNASHKWPKAVVTEITAATTWVRAEDYHQDYLLKNPGGYNDHFLRSFDF
jgi:methionine-S-sulfoxide reductase